MTGRRRTVTRAQVIAACQVLELDPERVVDVYMSANLARVVVVQTPPDGPRPTGEGWHTERVEYRVVDR